MIKKLLNSKFKKDLIFSYATQAISISFGFLQLFLINKYFGVNIYGQLAIIMSTAGIFRSLLTARSSEAVTRFFKREELNKNYENAKFVLFIGFVIDFITAMMLVLLIYISAEFISTTFLKNESLQQEIILYSIVIFFGFLRGSFIGFLQSQELFKEINTIAIVENVLKVTLLLISIFVLHRYGLDNIIYIFILASLASFLYTFYLFFKYYKDKYIRIRFVFNTLILKEYWNFNIKTFLSSSLKADNHQIDILVLSYFTSTYIIGIYSIFKKIFTIFNIVISQISIVTFTQIIKLYEMKNFNLLLHNIKRKTYLIFIIIIPMFFITLFLLNIVFHYMNIPFENIYLIVFCILFTKVIASGFMWWWRAFIITYNPTIPIYINIINLLNTILIPLTLFYIFKGVNDLLLISISNILIIVPMSIIGYYFFYTKIYLVSKRSVNV